MLPQELLIVYEFDVKTLTHTCRFLQGSHKKKMKVDGYQNEMCLSTFDMKMQ